MLVQYFAEIGMTTCARVGVWFGRGDVVEVVVGWVGLGGKGVERTKIVEEEWGEGTRLEVYSRGFVATIHN